MDALIDIQESGLDADTREEFARDVILGLSGDPKSLPCKWFYDVRGSELFEAITQLDEYYPTRTETALLASIAPNLGAALPAGAWVVEFGSGASRKSDLFLEALGTPKGYVPIDVSADYLAVAAGALSDRFPSLQVVPVVADFMAEVTLPTDMGSNPKIGFFPGSTIGNLNPAKAVEFLQRTRSMLGAGGSMVIGVDLKKDERRLVDAYDDAKGVTADFNLNLLDRINRELGGTFERDRFRHLALYNQDEGRIEMHLESLDAQTVRVAGRDFAFRAGETIHTENSYKYAIDQFAEIATEAGWVHDRHWTDADDLFSIHLLAS